MKDYFSTAAAEYARFRPDYPPALFEWIASLVERRRVAWDCATGNGQAARGLVEQFDLVLATDGSAAQLAAAVAHPRIRYIEATAEASGLATASVDVVTVAQALHWFDTDAFYQEVRRVVVPGGALVAWTYGVLTVAPEIDSLVEELYRVTLRSWWPPERRHVDAEYRSLSFPFAELRAPSFAMARQWTLGELLGYIGTWSATKRFRRERGDEVLTRFASRVADAWGPPERARTVRWPMAIRAGHVEGG